MTVKKLGEIAKFLRSKNAGSFKLTLDVGAALQYVAENGLVMQYDTVHQVHGEGDFVLTMSEGKFGKGVHVAYYDLFRLEDGLIVEHWDIIQPIPAKADWKNQNGKF